MHYDYICIDGPLIGQRHAEDDLQFTIRVVFPHSQLPPATHQYRLHDVQGSDLKVWVWYAKE